MLKLKFIKDHSPRYKGEIAVFQTRDEIRTAEWYLANQIAEVCKDCDCNEQPKKESKCADCDKKASEAVQVEETTEKAAEVVEVVIEETTEKADSELSLAELRVKYPHIKARAKAEFLKELNESK